ncbi:histamine H2 receptor-like [Acropora muricata]|uniref:histamine H2 receptor-like n=1 Tax=Acropora muricata TaxID=159855 RepID=UPI0034E475D7
MSSENNEINSEGMLKDRHTATVVTETTIFGLVTIVSFLGNLLVCYAVYRNPRLRNPSNYYIISLALTDILQASCAMPFSVAYLATGEWSFGTSACEFVAILNLSMTETSAFNMTLMALNRYYKVVKPNKYRAIFKPRNIVTTAYLAWIIPMTLFILSVFAFNEKAVPRPGYAICLIEVTQPAFFPLLFSLMYSLNFTIAVCYWKIYRKVKMHNANLSWQSSNAADVKVSKTLFVTVVFFVSLLLPADIILASYKIVGPENMPRFFSLLGILFTFMTSCTNPFIYGYMNRAFRSEFKKCLMLKRGHSVSESAATGQS